MKAERRVFDAHFHIGSCGTRKFAERTVTPIPGGQDHENGDDCAAYLRRYRIKGGIIVPTYLERQAAAFEYNRSLLDAVKHHDNLYGGLWVSPLPEVEALNEESLAYLPNPGIRAFKMAPNAWKGFSIDPCSWTPRLKQNVERLLTVAAEHNLVIHFHTGYLPGAEPLQFEAFMNEYGSVATYQFVHMGEAIRPIYRFVPRFVEWIEEGYDIYTDTSLAPGFAPNWLLQELQQRGLGVDRILFATDAPWGRFPSEYWKVEGLEVDDEAKDQIFWKNAIRLYGRRCMDPSGSESR